MCQMKKLGLVPELTKKEIKQIKDLYYMAECLTKFTGIPHEVDHVIPKRKRGLHHPNNLQILTRTANKTKGNTYDRH